MKIFGLNLFGATPDSTIQTKATQTSEQNDNNAKESGRSDSLTPTSSLRQSSPRNYAFEIKEGLAELREFNQRLRNVMKEQKEASPEKREALDDQIETMSKQSTEQVNYIHLLIAEQQKEERKMQQQIDERESKKREALAFFDR